MPGGDIPPPGTAQDFLQLSVARPGGLHPALSAIHTQPGKSSRLHTRRSGAKTYL
jgi:hypothetical protein